MEEEEEEGVELKSGFLTKTNGREKDPAASLRGPPLDAAMRFFSLRRHPRPPPSSVFVSKPSAAFVSLRQARLSLAAVPAFAAHRHTSATPVFRTWLDFQGPVLFVVLVALQPRLQCRRLDAREPTTEENDLS